MAAITAASAIALGGMAISAGTAGISFAQAGKQKSLQRQTERDAQNAFDQAKKDLGKNYYQALGIQKEPYELSREGLLASSYGLTQAAQESERGAAEAAGRIYLASQQGQGQVRSEMGQELSNLEKLTAQENSRLRDLGVGLDLEQAAGYQQAAQDAQAAAAAATAQGFSSAGDVVKAGVSEFVPLYFKQKGLDPQTGLPLADKTVPATTATASTPQPPQVKLSRKMKSSLGQLQSYFDANGIDALTGLSKGIPTTPQNNSVMLGNQNQNSFFDLNYLQPFNMMNYPQQ